MFGRQTRLLRTTLLWVLVACWCTAAQVGLESRVSLCMEGPHSNPILYTHSRTNTQSHISLPTGGVSKCLCLHSLFRCFLLFFSNLRHVFVVEKNPAIFLARMHLLRRDGHYLTFSIPNCCLFIEAMLFPNSLHGFSARFLLVPSVALLRALNNHVFLQLGNMLASLAVPMRLRECLKIWTASAMRGDRVDCDTLFSRCLLHFQWH